MERRKLKKNTTRPRPTRQMTAKRHTDTHKECYYATLLVRRTTKQQKQKTVHRNTVRLSLNLKLV